MSGAAVAIENRLLINWSAVIAGAVVAAAISFMLLAFGAAIGLSVMSTAPTWRDSSPWLWLLSGIFLVFVALCAFGFGGYVAGRMRSRTMSTIREEVEFSDGMHGIVTWALAILIAAVLGLAVAAAASPLASPGSNSAGPAPSVAGENIVASELDELLRTDARAMDANALSYRRAEAARILMKSSSHSGVSADDRASLAMITAAATGVHSPEAIYRADRAISESTQEIHRARQAAVMQAFLVAVALLVGAVVSWFAACEGGRERELNDFPKWDWSFRRRYS